MSHETPKRDWRKELVSTWFEFDPRALALFRIGFSIVLLWDLLRRVPDLAVWYSNQGLLPNHTQLWRPAAEYIFSVFFLASHTWEAALGFVLCGIVYLCLLVGWKTRLFQVLALVAVVSLHSRAVILENGGDVVMNLLALWSAFLPLGRRWSVDALLASLRRTREVRPEELGSHRERDADRNRPVRSLAVFAILLQLAVIYFFNTVHKSGPGWKDGSAVHWALHQDRIVTWLGSVVRDGFPLELSQILSWATLLAEGAAAILILSPVGRLFFRRIAMAALPAMHAGFAVFLNVGLFSPVMCCFFLLLPSAEDFAALSAWWRRRLGERTVYFDASCGICFQTARILTRMDNFGKLRFVPNTDEERLPQGVTPQIVEETIVVSDPEGRLTYRADAFASIFRSIPMGALVWIPLSLLRPVANSVYDVVARNRRRISESLGLAACGLPAATPALVPEPVSRPPILAALRQVHVGVREGLVLVFMLAATSQVLIENRAVPRPLRFRQPEVFRAMIQYGRFFQGWSMFAPNPPTTNGLVVVDARTVDGRRIDPLNYAATGWDGEPWEASPGRLGQDQFWCDYVARIERNSHLHHILEGWIRSHHRRTGRPEDRVVAFDAYWIEHETPAPGEGPGPGPLTRRKFLSWQDKSQPGVVKR